MQNLMADLCYYIECLRTAERQVTLSPWKTGKPLIEVVIKDGKLLSPSPSLGAIREHAARELAALPEHLRSLEQAPPYPVEISNDLKQLARSVDARSGGEC